MNRNDEGKLCGDVDFTGVSQVADHPSAGRRH
jgi:methylenetetrahydrofolate dehydrogenase (NADP+)/methenyltetrahydrofolate cyclohydrolase